MTIRLLTMTTLFPNPAMPRHGIFVRERLRHLVQDQPVLSHVVAPVPWFPVQLSGWGRYGRFAAVPRTEEADGITVDHPRFFTVPRLGNLTNPVALASSVMRLIRSGTLPAFDLIDAHYAFPDGVAAVLLGRKLGKPVTVTVRGSDVNVLPREAAAGWWLRRFLPRSDAVIAVSEDLADRTRAQFPALGDRLHVHPNGVDQRRFDVRPDRICLRRKIEARQALLCVGNLVPVKGQALAIRALTHLPQASLTLVGEGPLGGALRSLAADLGVSPRVRFLGNVDQSALVKLYNAADATLLTSTSEGMPNVVLESLACGTPVVATDVGGVREVVHSAQAGVTVHSRDPRVLAGAVTDVLAEPHSPHDVRAQVERLSWSRTSEGLYRTFEQVLGRGTP